MAANKFVDDGSGFVAEAPVSDMDLLKDFTQRMIAAKESEHVELFDFMKSIADDPEKVREYLKEVRTPSLG